MSLQLPATRVVLVTLALACGIAVSVATSFAEEKKNQPGLWLPADPDPPPASVVKAIEALKSLTVGELQSMEDYDLERLKDVARNSVDLITVEEKRRKDRGGRR